ncbi:MAG: phage portal protein [Acidobacteria bacterium]|nr:phage portal protein [Acidobacteriota bacterium]
MIQLGLSPPERRSSLENPQIPLSSPAAFEILGGGWGSDAGEVVNEYTAMRQATVFSCIKTLGESVASLPLCLHKVTDKGITQQVNSPLYRLLSAEPNSEMTAFSFFETLTVHLNLTGNAYAQIQRSNGVPIALWPLHPRLTRPVRLPSGDLAYETEDGGQKRILKASDVLHVPLTSWDGLVGLSPIQQAARAIGLSIGAEKYGSRLFRNGSVPLLALSTAERVKAEDKSRIRADFEALQSGDNQHRVAVLDQNLTLTKIGISPEEAQFLETRAYQRSDIAAIYRVPASFVGEQQKISNSNMQEQNKEFYASTIRALCSRIEAEINRKLFAPTSGLVAKFDLSERLRGDWESVAAAVTTMRQWSIATANEGRHLLGLPSLDNQVWGDSLLIPVNMTVVSATSGEKLLDASASVPAAAAPAPPEGTMADDATTEVGTNDEP